MSKDEILEKYGVVLENFCPAPNSAIKITIDQNMINTEEAVEITEYICELYPEYSVFTTFKGIDIK